MHWHGRQEGEERLFIDKSEVDELCIPRGVVERQKKREIALQSNRFHLWEAIFKVTTGEKCGNQTSKARTSLDVQQAKVHEN